MKIADAGMTTIQCSIGLLVVFVVFIPRLLWIVLGEIFAAARRK